MKRKSFWIMIGVGVTIVILLMILSSVLSVGDRLRSIHKYLEYGFYAIAILLVYILILNPLRIILFAPTFSVTTVFDENNNKKYRTYKKVTKNIIKNKQVDEVDKKVLLNSLNSEEDLKENLNNYFNKILKAEINKIVLRNAKTVMLSTAISQNGRLDMLTVLTVNLKMIKEIVLKCGFRPSYAKLGKLSVNVLSTALIAEGLEGLDFNDLFPNSTTNILSEIPLIKPLASSILQGISNALLTIRVGIVTRRYLFSEYKNISKNEIRRQSIKESIKLLPIVVKDVIKFFPSKFFKLFSKKTTVDDNLNEASDNEIEY